MSEKKGIILLHLDTIKTLGLHLGSLVVLHLQNKQVSGHVLIFKGQDYCRKSVYSTGAD